MNLKRRIAKVEAERLSNGGVGPVSLVFVRDGEPVPAAPEGRVSIVVQFVSPAWAKANPELLGR